ncbi:MAG TPA: Mur ligase family protein [Pirellulales bacterium]|jgi:UDP-N-acetylmuramyl pentapeptide synthase|nr:Mur ligase family protein [Pirellulales bacterium]
MTPSTLTKLHDLLGGRLHECGLAATDRAQSLGPIVTEIEHVGDGTVYCAVEGHSPEVAERAFRQGAAGIIAAQPCETPSGKWSLEVRSVRRALWELADWNRRRFRGELLAVVGIGNAESLFAAVLNSPPLAGASLTLNLLDLAADERYAVLPWQLTAAVDAEFALRYAAPTWAILTEMDADSVQVAALLKSLPRTGCAILNGDCPRLRRVANECRARVVWVGRGSDCDVQASHVRYVGGRLKFQAGDQDFDLPLQGRHQLLSALAAIALGAIVQRGPEQIAEILATWAGSRFVESGARRTTLFAATESRSFAALARGLDMLRELAHAGRSLVVCSSERASDEARDETFDSAYEAWGAAVVTLAGADLLIAQGPYAEAILAGAFRAGMPQRNTLLCRDWPAVCGWLRRSFGPADAVLVHGAENGRLAQLEAADLASPVQHERAA